MKPTNLVGRRFNRLVVLELLPLRINHKRHWRCRCDCGGYCSPETSNLTGGNTQSCGCRQRETVRVRNTTHRESDKPEYRIWAGVKSRCCNPNANGYELYGGRGVQMCERWKESFPNFLADMGRRPSLLHSVDRKDSNGPYAPDNCRWATGEEQGANQRTNIVLTYDGQTMHLSAWARTLGVPYHRLVTRRHRGWPVEKILSRSLFNNHGDAISAN